MQAFMFRDAPVTNAAAKQYAVEMLAIDDAEVKARRTMRSRMPPNLHPTPRGTPISSTAGNFAPIISW